MLISHLQGEMRHAKMPLWGAEQLQRQRQERAIADWQAAEVANGIAGLSISVTS